MSNKEIILSDEERAAGLILTRQTKELCFRAMEKYANLTLQVVKSPPFLGEASELQKNRKPLEDEAEELKKNIALLTCMVDNGLTWDDIRVTMNHCDESP